MEPAAQVHLGVLHGRPGRHREVVGAPRAPPGAVAPGDGRARRAPAPLALPSLRPPDPRQPPLAAPSPGYLAGRAWRLPILPFSALTCLRFMLPIVPPCLGHSFSASWHDTAEDVSPAIMKHIGEHLKRFMLDSLTTNLTDTHRPTVWHRHCKRQICRPPSRRNQES